MCLPTTANRFASWSSELHSEQTRSTAVWPGWRRPPSKRTAGSSIRPRCPDSTRPSYNADVQDAEGFPPGADRLRDCILTNDAFVISSPEYNASMPGSLKNTIDWVSRFSPQPFNEKHGLVMSASPSMVGGNRGAWALRVPFEHLGARVYPDMFSLAQAHQAFDEDGRIANEELQERFEQTIVGFMDLVEASKHYPCVKTRWVECLGEDPDPAIDRVE
jgi:chromate reductase, NAD(P)H dehydrogenase (quinone)